MACVAAVVLTELLAGGCKPKLKEPTTLFSPEPGVQLWAVAPFANESGVSTVNAYRVADLFTQQVQQVDGINTVPVNRVVLAMRHAGITSVASSDDALQLIELLDVDAIVVGTVTAWEPYPPPTMGMAVLLLAGSPDRSGRVDPRELVRATSGTLAWIEAYASGRTEPGEPFGTDVYLMDMELYTQFVSFRLIHDLLGYGQEGQTPVADAD
jgi:hypothetical protein